MIKQKLNTQGYAIGWEEIPMTITPVPITITPVPSKRAAKKQA